MNELQGNQAEDLSLETKIQLHEARMARLQEDLAERKKTIARAKRELRKARAEMRKHRMEVNRTSKMLLNFMIDTGKNQKDISLDGLSGGLVLN